MNINGDVFKHGRGVCRSDFGQVGTLNNNSCVEKRILHKMMDIPSTFIYLWHLHNLEDEAHTLSLPHNAPSEWETVNAANLFNNILRNEDVGSNNLAM